MSGQIVIKGPLVSLNEYIKAERGNRYTAASMKKRETQICALFTKTAMNRGVSFEFPCYLLFEWHVKNKKKDPDNIAFAQKFILDGFQDAGFLDNDGMNNILGLVHTFVIDRHEMVVVREISKEKFEEVKKQWSKD